MTTDDEVTRYHRERDVPAPLQKKLELLRHFTEYMDDFLTEGESDHILLSIYYICRVFIFFKRKSFLRLGYGSSIFIFQVQNITMRIICTRLL